MDIAKLKQETSADHDRVERSIRLMDGHLDLPTYLDTLQRLYGFVAGWEQWAAQANSVAVQALLCKRRRSALLRADLTYFATSLPLRTYTGPMLSPGSEPQVLGAMYVMEGSTLGGQFIARHVETTLALSPGQGDSFFRGYGDSTGGMWREMKDALAALPDSTSEETIQAAKALFHDFAQWNEDDSSMESMELPGA